MQKYYSPRLDRGLITRLYHAAKAEGIAMTQLANRLVERGLAECGKDNSPPPGKPTVKEYPDTSC